MFTINRELSLSFPFTSGSTTENYDPDIRGSEFCDLSCHISRNCIQYSNHHGSRKKNKNQPYIKSLISCPFFFCYLLLFNTI